MSTGKTIGIIIVIYLIAGIIVSGVLNILILKAGGGLIISDANLVLLFLWGILTWPLILMNALAVAAGGGVVFG